MTSGFLKGQKGQTSIEIAIITGAIFLIVISTIPYITDANTINKGVTAARDGATFAQTMLNMGYASDEASLPQGERVHVDEMAHVVDTTTEPGTKIVRITLTISGTSDEDVAAEIKNHAGNYINYAFNAEWNDSAGTTVNIGDYRFIVDHEFA